MGVGLSIVFVEVGLGDGGVGDTSVSLLLVNTYSQIWYLSKIAI